jgi:heavy metal translocating P-type ATPase
MSVAEPDRACAYCGLPLPRPWWPDEEGPAYCCFGCRFAASVTQAGGEQGAARWALTRLGLAIFLTMNVMVFTMALWTHDFYGNDPQNSAALAGTLTGLFRYLCLLFALPVLLLLGGPLLESGWQSLRHGGGATDLLLVIGVAASFLYSALSVYRDAGRVYFEVGCVVLVLVTLGRWLEATGKLKAGEAIEALHKLLPDRVRVLRPNEETCIPLAEVQVGDTVRVLAGERIPCDGRVLGHAVTVDEQVLTGEARPVVKEAGDAVLGGTLDVDSDLLLQVTAPARGGALARMIELVRQARLAKGRFERLADRVSAWFLPAVLLLALLTVAWHTYRQGPEEGILAGLAVLLIACPCALGIATPLALWVALGRAAGAQVLFRNGEALERLATVRAVRLDKTGTLTTGTSVVAEFAVDPSECQEVLGQAARLASSSNHTYAFAIRAFAGEKPHPVIPSGEGVRTLPGRGVVVNGVCLGNVRLMEENGLHPREPLAAVIERATKEGQPLTCVGWDRWVRGVFVFREELRAEAREAIDRLREQGLDVAVLTGDHAGRGAALGRELGVTVAAELLPDDKVTALAKARQAFGPVAMVGDGINDAPALAGSDVGVALGCGADVSRDAATVCLLGNDLRRLPWAVGLARAAVRAIRRNLFWAFAYNVLGIGLAVSGYLNPVWAALAMVLSSLFVVSNSLRLGSTAEDSAP